MGTPTTRDNGGGVSWRDGRELTYSLEFDFSDHKYKLAFGGPNELEEVPEHFHVEASALGPASVRIWSSDSGRVGRTFWVLQWPLDITNTGAADRGSYIEAVLALGKDTGNRRYSQVSSTGVSGSDVLWANQAGLPVPPGVPRDDADDLVVLEPGNANRLQARFRSIWHYTIVFTLENTDASARTGAGFVIRNRDGIGVDTINGTVIHAIAGTGAAPFNVATMTMSGIVQMRDGDFLIANWGGEPQIAFQNSETNRAQVRAIPY